VLPILARGFQAGFAIGPAARDRGQHGGLADVLPGRQTIRGGCACSPCLALALQARTAGEMERTPELRLLRVAGGSSACARCMRRRWISAAQRVTTASPRLRNQMMKRIGAMHGF